MHLLGIEKVQSYPFRVLPGFFGGVLFTHFHTRPHRQGRRKGGTAGPFVGFGWPRQFLAVALLMG